MIETLRAAMQSIIDETLGAIDTKALYQGTVVSQSGAELDVKLDDDRFGPGLQRIPYRTGIPGATATVPAGTRVAVGFDGGRRDRPAVYHFLDANPVTINLAATTTLRIAAGTTATVHGTKVKLGDAATLAVARTTDAVQAGPYAGTITGGSSVSSSE